MLQGLITKIPISLSRAYLLAGLFPIITTWLIIKISIFSWNELMINFQSLVDQRESYQLTSALIELLIVFIIAGIFLALRENIFNIFQTVPGNLLKPIRRQLMYRQLVHRAKSMKKRDMILFNLKVSEWYIHGFNKPNKVPNKIKRHTKSIGN